MGFKIEFKEGGYINKSAILLIHQEFEKNLEKKSNFKLLKFKYKLLPFIKQINASQTEIIKVHPRSFLDYISIVKKFVSIELIQETRICNKCWNVDFLFIEKEIVCTNCGYVIGYFSLHSINNREPQHMKHSYSQKRFLDKICALEGVIINSEQYAQLIALNSIFDNAYDQIKGKRISLLNINFRICKYLNILNIQYDSSKIKNLKTKSTLEQNEEIWNQICQITGWPN